MKVRKEIRYVLELSEKEMEILLHGMQETMRNGYYATTEEHQQANQMCGDIVAAVDNVPF